MLRALITYLCTVSYGTPPSAVHYITKSGTTVGCQSVVSLQSPYEVEDGAGVIIYSEASNWGLKIPSRSGMTDGTDGLSLL